MGRSLAHLWRDLPGGKGLAPEELSINEICIDSRQVRPGTLFVALRGVAADGHDYLSAALAAGATGLVVEDDSSLPADVAVPVLKVTSSRHALGQIAANYYDHPAAKMTMVAITGTNGKTTCSYLLEEVLAEAGFNPAVIGTVNYRFNGQEQAASHTTPEPVRLQGLLAEMAAGGVSHVIMEVSSHSLSQDRVAGIMFDCGIFTNLSRDHLDFHGDMASYLAAKERLFTDYLKGQAVLVDDGSSWSARLREQLTEKLATPPLVCGGCGRGAVQGGITAQSLEGMDLTVRLGEEELSFTSPLVGEFNLRNLLAVLAAGQVLGLSPATMVATLSRAAGAPGRLERVAGEKGPAVFVDYAHSPDALENVLATLRPLCSGQLIVAFGCGGERDQGKRAIMGRVAGEKADYVFLTSDNPRGEEPAQILADIEAGLRQVRQNGYRVIESRRKAIAQAIGSATSVDVVLLAGKGHEDYQQLADGKIFFDDRQEAREQLGAWS
ncbi:MAG: UDP-N-acetylmuramoyl-L-alanyl-D-glutamate--2,6-diaminopimelate ligase [Thermodesulfobacteriota bacterium]